MRAATGSRGQGHESKNNNQVKKGDMKAKDRLRPVVAMAPPNFIGHEEGVPKISKGPGPARKSLRLSSRIAHPVPLKQRAPRRIQSPTRKVIPPRHVREMDASMSILLDVRNDIPHSKMKEYDAALETILSIQSSAICKNFLSYYPAARKFIPVMEHQEEIAKQKLEWDKEAEELIAERDVWKSKATKTAHMKSELEKKVAKLTASKNDWKFTAYETVKEMSKLEKKAEKWRAERDNWKFTAYETAKEMSNLEKKAEKLRSERDKWKSTAEETVKEKLELEEKAIDFASDRDYRKNRVMELEKKAINLAANRDYWKKRVTELERKEPVNVKVPASQSDALDCPSLIAPSSLGHSLEDSSRRSPAVSRNQCSDENKREESSSGLLTVIEVRKTDSSVGLNEHVSQVKERIDDANADIDKQGTINVVKISPSEIFRDLREEFVGRAIVCFPVCLEEHADDGGCELCGELLCSRLKMATQHLKDCLKKTRTASLKVVNEGKLLVLNGK